MANTKSKAAYERACRVMPGGVNSPVRAFGSVGRFPIFVQSAKGSKIYDIDQNEYIDYVGSWGPAILGHSRLEVIEAIQQAAARGTSFGAPTEAETLLAEKISSAITSVEKIRMVASGTEAVMTAVRLAREYTDKNLIIKMQGCYHGHSDCLLVEAGSAVAELATASSGGVTDSVAAETIVLPYNDAEAAKIAFEKYSDKIAAVIVEPVAANMSVVLPVAGYLETLRDLCSANKSLLIFDEVITGFRVTYGSAQQLFGIDADLTCLGKIVGGGLPSAALGGSAEIMDHLSPLGNVYQAGTLSGNPLATAAANVTLDILAEGDCYDQLEKKSAKLETAILAAAKKINLPVVVNRLGSLMGMFFTDRPVENFDAVRKTDINRFKQYFGYMLDCGIYLAPSAYEAMFISTAHSAEDIDKTIEAITYSFNRIISAD